MTGHTLHKDPLCVSFYVLVFATNDALMMSTSSSVFEVRLFLLFMIAVFPLIFTASPVSMLPVLLLVPFAWNSVRDGIMSLEYSAVGNQVIIWVVIVEMLLFLGVAIAASAVMLTYSNTAHVFHKDPHPPSVLCLCSPCSRCH